MIRFIIISIFGGIIFAILDGIINANPLAQKFMESYTPIAKASINMPVGILIDLFYGFMMCGIFLLLYNSLPSGNPVIKGLIYGLIIWFFRVLMSVLTTYMTLQIPVKTLVYILLTGLLEVIIIGIFYGLTIKPIK